MSNNIWDSWYKAMYADKLKDLVPDGVKLMRMIKSPAERTIEDWISIGNLKEEDYQYSNAVAAKEIMESPLFNTLKEDD